MAYHESEKSGATIVYDSYVNTDADATDFEEGIYFGYVDGAGNTHYTATNFGENEIWIYYCVSVSVATQTVTENGKQVSYSASQIEDYLDGITWDLSIARDSGSIALFYGIDDDAPADQAAAAPAAEGEFEDSTDSGSLTLKEGGAYTEAGVNVYFGVYINGDEHTTDDDEAHGNFTVTLSNSDNYSA